MAIQERYLLFWFEQTLRELLPADWLTRVSFESAERAQAGLWDATLAIRAPDGSQAVLPIEVRAQLTPKQASRIADRIRSGVEDGWGESRALVLSEYLSPGTRAACRKAGLGYADRSGALRIQIRSPTLFVERAGAARNPNPRSRGIASFRGRGAARIARVLIDTVPPLAPRAIGSLADVSPASVSKVLSLLQEEALLERKPRGPVAWTDWPGIARRWAQDYAVETQNRAGYFLAARGVRTAIEGLLQAKTPYAISGAVAAERGLRTLPEPRLLIYAADPEAMRAVMQLRQSEPRAANVVLLFPYDERVVLESRTAGDRFSYAPWSQVVVDLLTGRDREPSAGENLMQWMVENEERWRRVPGADPSSIRSA